MKRDAIIRALLMAVPAVLSAFFWMRVDSAMRILMALLTIAIAAASLKGGLPLVLAGLKQTGRTLGSMWFRILLGMALGGFIQVLVPSNAIAEWLGPASGLKGILIGSYTGLFLSGGPYVILPVVASIYHSGAGAGPTIALLAGGLLSVQGLIAWYIPLLGMRLSISNYLICIFVPPLVGLAGGVVFRMIGG